MSETQTNPIQSLADAIAKLAEAHADDMDARRAQAETNFQLVAAMKAVGAAYCPASDAAALMGTPLPDCFLHEGLFVGITASGKVYLRDQAFAYHHNLTTLAAMADAIQAAKTSKPKAQGDE